jgi:probable rRNA maturation factor
VIDIEIEDAAWTAALPDAEALARAAAQAVLALLPRREDDGGGGPPAEERVVEGAQGGDLQTGGSAPPPSRRDPRRATSPVLYGTGEEPGVTLLLADDEAVRDLNARFREQDKPTNVLSFPAPANPEHFLGDVALAYGVCAREAAEQGKPLAHHLQHLVIHGVLHLLGYDHIGDDEAEVMEGLERNVLAGLGVPDPYAAGEGEHDRSRPSE